ncbi:MAG TPA: DUF4350 domain-containing protein [Acidimicrobiales bacterium]|nr:DUF4350 domain-containing protein [Acidimicrobiales bacterium]
MSNNRGVLLAVGIVVVVLVGVLLLGRPTNKTPLDPRSDEPSGTSALVVLLRQLDVDVRIGVRDVADLDQDTDVVLLLRDRLDGDQHDRLLEWVRDGGTLVAVDPGSPLTPLVDSFSEGFTDDPAAFAVDDLVDTDAGICDIDALDDPDMDELAVYGGPVSYQVDSGAESCFGRFDAGYIVATPEGTGTVVAVGGSGILINRSLDEADNAPVAAALLAPRPGMHVTVLDPNAPQADGEGKALIDLVSPGVKRALVQLGLAFLVYVLWRSRRLGRPVAEPQPVAVAGSELVSAVGGLLQRAGSPQHAADLLREDLRRDLVSRLGLPARMPHQTFVAVVAGRTQLDAGRLAAALGPSPVNTDGDLLAVAQLIDAVRKEVFDHVGS